MRVSSGSLALPVLGQCCADVQCCIFAGFDWDAQDCLYMGTVDYSSVRALRGHHPSAWDDLEGLAITLLEMATGEPHVTAAVAGAHCRE